MCAADKPGDPESIDCTMNITILEPEADPMIHKAFPGGIDDLREYVLELKGFKDSWVKNMNDPDDTRWEYTYHGRLANYGSWKELRDPADKNSSYDVGFSVDQIQHVIKKLSDQPFSRQAQMISRSISSVAVLYRLPAKAGWLARSDISFLKMSDPESSFASRGISTGTLCAPLRTVSGKNSGRSTEPRATTSAAFIAFSSSRTFPGQGYRRRIGSVSGENARISVLKSGLNRSTK